MDVDFEAMLRQLRSKIVYIINNASTTQLTIFLCNFIANNMNRSIHNTVCIVISDGKLFI